MTNAEVLDVALALFRRRDLAEAEIYLEDSVSEAVAVADGAVESVEHKVERGAGVRVVRGGRVGFAYTSDLRRSGLEAMVDRAASASSHAGADASRRLPEPGSPPEIEGNFDAALLDVPTADKIALARRMEEAARALDGRVDRTRQARYEDVHGSVWLGRAGGHRYHHSFSRAVAFVDLVASDGDERQSGFHIDFALGPGGLDPEAIGRESAARALRKLGGRPCGTRRGPLLLAPDVVDGLLESLAPIFFGEEVLKGKSMLAGKVGERVAAPCVTLVDDGRLAGGYATAPVDGEGVPTGETVLLSGGVLQGFLHDGFSARKMSVEPTGNADRSSYCSTPSTGTTALRLQPTGESGQALLSGVEEGLLIEEVMGLHTINPVSGDFSVGALGRAVRRGETVEAVAGIGMAGNVRDLLLAIVAVGDDVRLMPSGNAASTVLLEGIAVSGA